MPPIIHARSGYSKLYPANTFTSGMNCGNCGGKGCCSSEETDTTVAQIEHDSLFITFKVFPLDTKITMFSLST